MNRTTFYKIISSRLTLVFTFLAFGLVVHSQPAAPETAPQQPRSALEEFLAHPTVNAASTAVYISNLQNGKVLASHNTSVSLMGASTMKLVTIASLLHKRDINYRFPTRVETAGRIVNGVLEGNLHIISSGDPTIASDKPPKSPDLVAEIVRSLKRRGISAIAGEVIIDQSIFPGPAQPASWSAGDCAQDYGAGAFGFNYRRNRRGSSSVSNPSAVFLSELEKAFGVAGIRMEKRKYTGGGRRVILNHFSAPLDEIMRSCMMRSDNLYAECMLRDIAVASGKSGSTTNGASEVMAFWQRNKAPMQGVKIYDGSGLSRSDRLTAQFLAHILRLSCHDPYFPSFFPLAGTEGTLARFLSGTRLENYVAMKTGSLHDVQAYAGYKLDYNYTPTHIVVVLTNGFRGSRASYRKAVEKLLLSYL